MICIQIKMLVLFDKWFMRSINSHLNKLLACVQRCLGLWHPLFPFGVSNNITIIDDQNIIQNM